MIVSPCCSSFSRQPNVLIAGRQNQYSNYVNALNGYGMNCLCNCAVTSTTPYDALLLPGGGDIEPGLYGEENFHSTNIDFDLDLQQLDLVSEFVYRKKPILGICKGIQIINTFFGGTICQEINQPNIHGCTLQGDNVHPVSCTDSSFLFPLYGRDFVVNSAHHQCVAKLGKHLLAQAYADRNVIEALCHDVLPILGVQWHPERMCLSYGSSKYCDGGCLLSYFRSLLLAC